MTPSSKGSSAGEQRCQHGAPLFRQHEARRVAVALDQAPEHHVLRRGGANQSLGYDASVRALPGTIQSSIPSRGGAFGGGLGWTTMRGSARIRAHSEGSAGTNAFSESNGIGSPACAGHEKGSRVGSLCLFDRSKSEDVRSPPIQQCRGHARGRVVGYAPLSAGDLWKAIRTALTHPTTPA